MPADDDLLAAARRLADAAGLAAPVAVDRISGGKNNRVFRVTLAAGEPVVLKSYHADPRDPRDRLDREFGFLEYAWSRGIRAIPRPLAKEKASHSGLYSFLPGRKLLPGEVDRVHVDAAADFVYALNAPPRAPMSLPPGSEACFTLAAHLEAVERRVGRLAALDAEAPGRDAADAFVTKRLAPAWRSVKARTANDARRLGLSLERELATAEHCVSPSDFGFHNALVEGEASIRFVDFEYAGRDDAAKLVCDFFCQPDVPVPLDHFEHFLDRVATGLDLGDDHRVRCRLLLDAYRVKWVCIMLNDFLATDSARRAFADPGARADRCSTQLARAAEGLSRLGLC